jgi:hypothetical protein
MCILFGEVLQAFVDFDTFGTCDLNLTSGHASNLTSGLASNLTSGQEAEVPFSPQAAVNRTGWGMCVIGFATWLGRPNPIS